MKTETQKPDKPKDYGKRSARHFAFGDRFGQLLRNLLPIAYCSAAAATCRFEIIGSDAWDGRESCNRPAKTGQGRTFRTRLQTFGNRPSDNFKGVTPRAKWTQSDAVAGANEILACFGGIAMADVIEHFGNVEPTEIKTLDLVDIVTALRPGLIRQTDPHAIATTALAGKLAS